jgi:Tfp pilus assembly protein PilF
MEDTTYLFGLLSLIIILIFVYLKREKKLRYYWLGLICFILFLLPVASIKENALEHRLYLSAIGFSLMCMESNFINNIRFDKGVGRWIMIFIVLLFSALTIRNSKNYKDEISFWSKALETSPHSAKAHLQMGSYYQIEGKIENAEMEYKTAIELKPDFPNTHNNLGKIYLDKGNLAEAQKFFLQELRIKPNPVAYYNLSSVQEDNGNFEEAKIYLKKSLEMDPNYADALVDLGILNAREQKYDDALDLLQKTIKSDPKNKLAYKNTALVYLAKKQYVKAKEYYLLSKQMGVDLNIPLLDTLVSH